MLRKSNHSEKTTLQVHLQPGAKTNALVGYRDGVLYAKVTALPQKGQANRALLEFMAETLDIPKSALSIIRGQASRNKVIAIRGLNRRELEGILAKNLPCKDLLHLGKG